MKILITHKRHEQSRHKFHAYHGSIMNVLMRPLNTLWEAIPDDEAECWCSCAAALLRQVRLCREPPVAPGLLPRQQLVRWGPAAAATISNWREIVGCKATPQRKRSKAPQQPQQGQNEQPDQECHPVWTAVEEVSE